METTTTITTTGEVKGGLIYKAFGSECISYTNDVRQAMDELDVVLLWAILRAKADVYIEFDQ